MLKNVESSYFIKKIFSFLEEGKKLKIVKINQSLQKILDLSIINYKHYRGVYIIYEPKGIGKEYFGFNDGLRYEGEYLNGQRNGKGKEYNLRSDLIYEGEFINGQRNGKGKEYYNNENLRFEGQYLDDEELIGTKYDINGDIKYKLDHTKGEGKDYDLDDELCYEGEYLNGKRNGKGKEYYH